MSEVTELNDIHRKTRKKFTGDSLINNKRGKTAKIANLSKQLFEAVQFNQLDLASALLQAGVNPNMHNKQSFTPLHIAACNGHTDMVDLLVNFHGQVEKIDNDGNTALFHAVYHNHFSTMERLIVQHHANIRHTDSNKGTLLHIACFKEYGKIVQFLINTLQNELDCGDQNGITPCHIAAAKGNLQFIEWFASAGFNLEAKDYRVPSLEPIHYAEIYLPEAEFLSFEQRFLELRTDETSGLRSSSSW